MTTDRLFARDAEAVKAAAMEQIQGLVTSLFVRAPKVNSRQLEVEVWRVVFSVGRLLLAALFARACLYATEVDIERRGLAPSKVRLRLERGCWARLKSTFGQIVFPMYAYRDLSGPACVGRTPALEQVLPLYPRTRSTELSLDRECWLGKEFPFRQAEEALRYLTLDEVTTEDTTIAAHMARVGAVIDRKWLYRPVDEIRELVMTRAARSKVTGLPVVYMSSDAHAERRYVDDTWNAAWKMANGLRIWIVDRNTGATTHLGGEFTWGDCAEVARIVDELVAAGILPKDGDYGDGVVCELKVVSDGLPWIEEYVVKRLPWAEAILDLYHALDRLSRFAALCFGAGTKAATTFYRRLTRWFAPLPRSKPQPKNRRGHVKRKSGPPPPERPSRHLGCGWSLLGTLFEVAEDVPEASRGAYETLLDFVEHNTYRTDYAAYEAAGLQLGSGAMESLHRTGGQRRLKIPGGHWLPETSQAIFNLRMLHLAGRWTEFWNHGGITPLLQEAFGIRNDQRPCPQEAL